VAAPLFARKADWVTIADRASRGSDIGRSAAAMNMKREMVYDDEHGME